MEAKDEEPTILPPDYISWREHQNLVDAQAEISYRAGIREVVEWLDKNLELYWRSVSTTKHDYYIPLSLGDIWQAKLKEWGIS